MIGPRGDWRGPPPSSQLAFRVAVLGGLALVVFVVVFLRLWYLQVLSGDSYASEAENNQVREFTVQAPRGEILDREGRPMVQNRTALELQLETRELPRSGERRARLLARLGGLTGMSPQQIRHQIRAQTRELPSSPVRLQRDVEYDVVYYLRENQNRFPGVSVQRVFVRRYPQGSLAAHLVGYVREVDEAELEDPRYDALDQGDFVGKEGVEATYDSLLRGVNGETRVRVDASGTPTARPLETREPRTGNDLVLTIDSDVQAAGEAAIGQWGLPAAFVAMKVNNGEVLGMGSAPSYDPSLFARPLVSPATARLVFGDPDDPASTLAAPAVNRAISGLYPTGSTYKPITALAALDADKLEVGETINDTGSYDPGDGNVLKNAGDAVNGIIDLRRALAVSSDVFFYILGARTDVSEGPGGALQEWSRALGIGEATGLDVPGEAAGRVPTPEERNEAYERNTAPDSPGGEEVVISKGEITDREWAVGDNINLAVGQGDLQANPLQMAVAYGAIANGGRVVTPHVGLRVDDPQGRTIQEIDPPPRREVEIDPAWQRTIMDGLRDAAMAPGGTSYQVFGGFPVEIAGKTGTAERPPRPDQAWYVALAPYDDPKYVVAVTIEGGGFGADTAAPSAAQILTELLRINERKIESVGDTGQVYE